MNPRQTVKTLTAREIQTAMGISQGMSYAVIGKTLKIPLETIRSYAKGLRDKTGLRKQAQLAVWTSENLSLLDRRLAELQDALARQLADLKKVGTVKRKT